MIEAASIANTASVNAVSEDVGKAGLTGADAEGAAVEGEVGAVEDNVVVVEIVSWLATATVDDSSTAGNATAADDAVLPTLAAQMS